MTFEISSDAWLFGLTFTAPGGGGRYEWEDVKGAEEEHFSGVGYSWWRIRAYKGKASQR